MPDQGSRSTAGLLQLPCRALGSLADDEPHRKRIRNGPAQDSTDERFLVANDRQADGVQVGHRRIKNLATAERHKSLAEDCRGCQIQRWHRGPRSAGKPRRLIAPRHLKSLIARACLCVPKTLSELMTGWNRLSWRNNRAALFRSGR